MDLSICNKIPQYKQILHPINSKNLPGELYAATAPGFWTMLLLILLKMCRMVFLKT